MAKETDWLKQDSMAGTNVPLQPSIPVMPVQLTTIMSCKYLLPCGKCDKTDEMCSQYQEVTLHT